MRQEVAVVLFGLGRRKFYLLVHLRKSGCLRDLRIRGRMEHLGLQKVKSFGFLIFAVKIQLDAQVLVLSFITILFL